MQVNLFNQLLERWFGISGLNEEVFKSVFLFTSELDAWHSHWVEIAGSIFLGEH